MRPGTLSASAVVHWFWQDGVLTLIVETCLGIEPLDAGGRGMGW